MNRTKFFITLLAILTLISAASATNGTRLIGFGVKMNGRGGTGIGMFDSPSLMMTNPAGIAFMEGAGVGVNFGALMPIVKFKNNLNDKTGDANTYPTGGIGYVSDRGPMKNLSWGVGLFTLGGMGADFKLNHALYKDASGNYIPQTYHSKLGTIQVGPSFAYKFNDKFAAGISLHLYYSQLEFEMPFSMPPSFLQGVAQPGVTFGQMFASPPLSYTELTAAAKMSDLTAISFGGKVGFAYKPCEKLSFGFNYSSPVTSTHKNGKAAMDMSAQFNDAFAKMVGAYVGAGMPVDTARARVMASFAAMGINPALGMEDEYDLEAELINPQSIGIGVGFKATEKLTIACDVEYINWKDAYEKMALSLKNGKNANINRLMGINGAFNVDFPMEWKDAIMFRIGLEHKCTDKFTGRVGYAFGSNPVPSETVFSIFPAIVESHITLGGTYDFTQAMSLHVAYETTLNNSQTASNPSKIASEYNGSTSQLAGSFVNIGFAWKLR